MPPATLTKRQYQALTFIGAFVRSHGYSPTLTEIRDALGLSANSGAKRVIDILIKAGYLARAAHKSRGITIVEHARDIAYEKAWLTERLAVLMLDHLDQFGRVITEDDMAKVSDELAALAVAQFFDMSKSYRPHPNVLLRF